MNKSSFKMALASTSESVISCVTVVREVRAVLVGLAVSWSAKPLLPTVFLDAQATSGFCKTECVVERFLLNVCIQKCRLY